MTIGNLTQIPSPPQLSWSTEPQVEPFSEFELSWQLHIKGKQCVFKVLLMMTMREVSPNSECHIYSITLGMHI